MNIWLQMVHGGSADLLWIPADLYSETENLLINSDVSVTDRIKPLPLSSNGSLTLMPGS